MGDYIRRHRATGTGNIDETITPGTAFMLEGLKLHLSAAGGANDLTLTIDANADAVYDVVLLTQDMTIVEDLYWAPERPIHCENGDKMVIAWTNGSSRTFGLEVMWRGI